MPIFEYECKDCGHVTEFLEKRGTGRRHKCGKCGSLETQKVFSTFAAQSAPVSPCEGCPSGTCPLSQGAPGGGG